MTDGKSLKEQILSGSLILQSGETVYSSADIAEQIVLWNKKLSDSCIYNKLVGICSNDNILQFVLLVALWDSENSIMFLNPNNGKEYADRVVENYKPDFMIYDRSFYAENEDLAGKPISEDTENGIVLCSFEKGNKLIEGIKGCIFFTSGTTDVPKAVLRSEKNMRNDALCNIYSFDITSEDKLLFTVPFGHVYGLGSGIVPFAMQGATVIFVPPFYSAKKLKKLIQDNKVTCIIASPMIYQELLIADTDLSECRLMLSAGSKLSNALIEQFYDKYHKNINNMYGSSETGAIATLYADDNIRVDNTNCGQAMKLIEVYCDGTEEKNGIIKIKSDSIADGIIKDDCIEPLVNSDGWLEMNDMGFIDENNHIHLICRKDDMINIGGEKLSPQTIEKIVDRYYEQSVVLVEKKDDETVYPVLYIAADDVDLDLLAEEMKKRLSYKFIPRKIVVFDDFPRNTNGKIVRNKLREKSAGSREYELRNFKYISC